MSEMKEPDQILAKMYVGQIWINAEGTIFRQILGLRRKLPGRIKFSDVEPETRKDKGEWKPLDEFLWWAKKYKTRPIVEIYSCPPSNE